MASGAEGGSSRAEQISALIDGELTIAQAKLLLPELVSGEARQRWDVYHLIGDALRDHHRPSQLAVALVAVVAHRLALEQ